MRACFSHNIALWAGLALLAFAGQALAQIQRPFPLPPTIATAPSGTSVEVLPERGKIAVEESQQPAAPKMKSLFFSKDEVKSIQLAMNTYLKNSAGKASELTLDEEEFLRQLIGVKKETAAQGPIKFFTYPQFFLTSLVYHGAKDWAVIVNDRKFIPDTAQAAEDLKIISIDENKVELQWKPEDMEKISEVWMLLAAPPANVEVDMKYGMVTFTLKPNQTFSSYAMAVLEGKVMPVTVENRTGAGGVIIPDKIIEKDGTANEELIKTEMEKKLENIIEEKEGLGGLLGAYKKVGETNP